MKCKYCRQELQSKLSVLKAHALCKKHKINSNPFKGLQKKINFNEPSPLQKTARKCEARMALYIACHSSINPVDHLINCEKENHKTDPISSELTLGRTKCTAILKNVWGPCFKNQLKADIAETMFSLIIDEATDSINTTFIGIIIKYYSKKRKNIITTFLAMEQCYDSTADGIAKIIAEVLKHFNLCRFTHFKF